MDIRKLHADMHTLTQAYSNDITEINRKLDEIIAMLNEKPSSNPKREIPKKKKSQESKSKGKKDLGDLQKYSRN